MSGLTIIADGVAHRVPRAVEAAQAHATILEGNVTEKPAGHDTVERWISGDKSAVEAEVASAEEDRIAAEAANAGS